MEKAELHVGIDFSKKRADTGMYGPEGEIIEMHKAYSNTRPGYKKFKETLMENLEETGCRSVHISGEATSYYWMPFFLELEGDEDLKRYDVHQYLLNPRMVKWYKKSLPDDHKTDERDPYYIASSTRVHRPTYEWKSYKAWLPLRFYTRLRFHLAKMLTQEKNYCHAILYLLNNAYTQQKPFNDIYGVTSLKILRDLEQVDALGEMDEEELSEYLYELSGRRICQAHKNARKLKLVAEEYFQLDEELTYPLQQVLNVVLNNIQFLQSQIQYMEGLIAEEAKRHPEICNLATIPGIGPVFSSGIAAEIGDLNRFFEGQKWEAKKKAYRQKNLRDVDAAIAKLAGLWWPRSASGDFESEDRRLKKSGNRYLRYYLIEAAESLRLSIPAYSDYYHKKYGEVNRFRHKRALVLTARKSIRLFVGLLHRNEPYCPKDA